MSKRAAKKPMGWIYWTPRVLSILFVLWLMLFSLDVFDEKLGFWGTILGLFMHNLPALILLAFTIVAWKRDIVGAIVFLIGALLYISMMVYRIMLDRQNIFMIFWTLPISAPAMLISILYFIGWRRKRKAKHR